MLPAAILQSYRAAVVITTSFLLIVVTHAKQECVEEWRLPPPGQMFQPANDFAEVHAMQVL